MVPWEPLTLFSDVFKFSYVDVTEGTLKSTQLSQHNVEGYSKPIDMSSSPSSRTLD